jgi:hypothetical protein
VKLRVVHDDAGVIVAAVAIGVADDELVPEPVPGHGETLIDLDVPGNHREEDLDALCTSNRVDISQARLVPFDDGDAAGRHFEA